MANISNDKISRFIQETENNNLSKEIPNPGKSILFFIILTTIVLILKILILPSNSLEDFHEDSKIMNVIFIMYLLLLLSGNFILNLAVSSRLCNNTPQWSSTFIITFLPWILIFGVINLILVIFPGWLVPFSNTFGFFAVNIFGIKDLFNKEVIRIKADWGGVDLAKSGNIEIAKALQQIYGNESLLINEIPRIGDTEKERAENFDQFYKTMQKLEIFQKNENDQEKDNKTKVKLYKLLKIKDYIAEYVWFILTGILVVSISYNYIANIKCNFNARQMSDSLQRFLNESDRSEATEDRLNRIKNKIMN